MTHKNKADESHREAYGANSSPANTLNELGIHIHEYEDSGLGRRRGVRRGEGSEARQNNDDQIVRQNRQKMI